METQTSQVQTSEKNAWLYAILLWFLGYLGVHKFYLNKTGMGIIYLFTLGILGIGILIDIISLIFFTVKDNKGQVLTGALSLKIVTTIVVIFTVILIASIAPLLLTG